VLDLLADPGLCSEKEDGNGNRKNTAIKSILSGMQWNTCGLASCFAGNDGSHEPTLLALQFCIEIPTCVTAVSLQQTDNVISSI